MGSVGISGPHESGDEEYGAATNANRAAGRRLCHGNSKLIYLRVDLSSN